MRGRSLPTLPLVVLALAAALGLPAAAGAVLGGTNGRIVFVSGRSPAANDGEAKVYLRTTIGSTGGGSVGSAITSGAGQYRHPTWSPDREKIAYARHDGSSKRVYIHNLVTGAITPISNAADVSDRPAWSPDGTRIAFETTAGGQTDIIVYTVASGATLNLTTGAFPATEPSTKPAWSPDSQLVYYTRGAPGGMAPGQDADIVVEVASGLGSPSLAVPDSELSEFQPSISPDGTKICFTLGGGFDGTADVWVAPLATPASQTLLSQDNVGSMAAHGDYNCTWSPDGVFIAYVRGTFSLGDLVMERADNSNLTPFVLENVSGRFDGNPDWAPDGRPACKPAKAQTVRGGSVVVKLTCSDTGPAYERTPVTKSIRDFPLNGSVGPVTQGNPARVTYTASTTTGPDTFTFHGADDFGFGPHATATIEVLLPGRCANLKKGNNGANTLVGTRFGDRIRGFGGADVLRGLEGDDCLEGGRGNDLLVGGAGNDVLMAGAGQNTLNGGAGNDVIRARNGRADLVLCGAGRRDVAEVDFADSVSGCERVRRG
jgi:Tol biopolymer transport system component